MKKYISLFFIFFIATLASEQPILIVIGTRPEAVKVIPVYEALKREGIPVLLCSTGQHTDLLQEAFSVFHVEPDFQFQIMKSAQTLSYITEAVLRETTALIQSVHPSMVIVQGDTTTAMTAALAAFYCKVPVAHIEAGLRTHNLSAPFPEELNRQLIARIASLHFTPTSLATKHLIAEGISPGQIYETGNTVVDALYKVKEELNPSEHIRELASKPFLLLTAHRRESLDTGLREIFDTIYTYLLEHPKTNILYPVHPNPRIAQIIKESNIHTLPNLILLPPLSYFDFVYLLTKCDGVLTDSGGVQEEAVSLNKPTLILRNETDRPEGGILVGTDSELIRKGLDEIAKEHSPTPSPYGDGHASEQIVSAIQHFLKKDPQ